MGRRTLLLIASILVAALGTALIWLYVQGADTRAQQGADLVPVLVVDRQADPGTPARSLNLRTDRVPATLAANAVTNRADLEGFQLVVGVTQGQLLLRSMLTKGEGKRFPQGGAISISISDPNRVPADLRPSDCVDVYGVGASAKGRPVVSNIKVRSIGTNTPVASASDTGGVTRSVPLTIVGFDANSDEAAALVAMLNSGQQPVIYDKGAIDCSR